MVVVYAALRQTPFLAKNTSDSVPLKGIFEKKNEGSRDGSSSDSSAFTPFVDL